MEKKAINVSDNFRQSAIEVVEKIVAKGQLQYTMKELGNGKWIEKYVIPGTQVAIVFADIISNEPRLCDVSIGDDVIRFADKEQVQRLFVSVRKRRKELGQEKQTEKETQLLDKLQEYLTNMK